MTDYELAIVAHKGQKPIEGKRDGSVWQEGKVFNLTQVHPTEKPVNLLERVIAKFSKPQDLIIDPFLGSGSTTRAALNLNRRFIGIEISPEYCKIARNRLKQQVLNF